MKIEFGKHLHKKVGVLTSGGDSQGMNAALRAIVRTGIFLGCDMYFIKEGYKGLIEGGKLITSARWSDVSGIISIGGTIIGSARSKEFMTPEGRAKAAKNLIDRSIQYLIIIGGDGSLTGANQFRNEWPELVKRLLSNGEITQEDALRMESIQIIGMLGTIDNDFYGTDYTIGTSSALHRIQEAIDSVLSTAFSQKRIFVLELMGRRCGYLSLATMIGSEADYVFYPECPPSENWREEMCAILKKVNERGERVSIVIVAEGATDLMGEPITTQMVKEVIDENLQADAQITVLGHVQRGGISTAYDRFAACQLGVASVVSICESTPNDPAYVLVLNKNRVEKHLLVKSIESNSKIATFLKEKQWQNVVEIRNDRFKSLMNVVNSMSEKSNEEECAREKEKLCFAIVQIGGTAAGVNAVTHAFVRRCLQMGHTVYCVHNGIFGFINGHLEEMNWTSVTGWISSGGSFIGTKRQIPNEEQMKIVAQRLKEYNIKGLAIAGGYDAFMTCKKILQVRESYEALRIPIALIPATATNNVPGSDYSVGFDTALNGFTGVCDRVQRMSAGLRHVAHLAEVTGGYNSRLATVGGVTSGADYAYTYESDLTANELIKNIYDVASKMSEGPQRALIIKTSKANVHYDVDFIFNLFAEEGDALFKTVKLTLGNTYEGGIPSVYDRIAGCTMGREAFDVTLSMIKKDIARSDGGKQSVFVMRMIYPYHFEPVSIAETSETLTQSDIDRRVDGKEVPKVFTEMLRLLATHDSAYTPGMEFDIGDIHDNFDM